MRTYIGYAQQEEGDFAGARASYEQAVRIFQNNPPQAADEAAALDNLANLDQATGELKTALKLEQRSLQLFEMAGNHGGAARTLAHMAVIELTRKHHLHKAERDLDGAAAEARKAPDLGKDYQVGIDSIKGWIADFQGDTSAATFYYAQALALESRKDSMEAGWEFVLLGRAY